MAMLNLVGLRVIRNSKNAIKNHLENFAWSIPRNNRTTKLTNKTIMNTQKQAKNSDFSMIDTLAIRIRYPNFKVIIPQLFTPALIIKESAPAPYNFMATPTAYGRNRFKKYTQNMTASDKKNSVYKPKLTAYQRFDSTDKEIYDLHLEFSVPKIIFGNSVREVGEEHLGALVGILKRQLWLMGIEVSAETLLKAIVVKAHFSKNIPLPHPLNSQDAIAGLYKADMGRGKDINMREFRNGGTALYFYATYYNVIFYDKLRDIATPKNKAIDKDKLKSEWQLIKSSEFEQEILRFEVRLAKQTKLNHFLSDLLNKQVKNITLEEIFKKEICQKALLKTWGEITNIPANQLAFKLGSSPEEVFDEMIKSLNPDQKKKNHSLNKTLASFGLYTLIQHKGVRWIRNRIEKNWTDRSWSRLSGDIKESATALRHIPNLSAVGDIKTALDKFERYDWKTDF